MRGGLPAIRSESGGSPAASRTSTADGNRSRLEPKRGLSQPTVIVFIPHPVEPIRHVRAAGDGHQAGRLGSSSSAPDLGRSSKPLQFNDSSTKTAWDADSDNWSQGILKTRSATAGVAWRNPNRLDFDEEDRPKSGPARIGVDEALASVLAPRSKKSQHDGIENAIATSPKGRRNFYFSRSNTVASRDEGASLDGSIDLSSTLGSTLTNRGWPLSPRGPEECRQALRHELMKIMGGGMEAFRSLDLNASGRVSLTEFSEGLTRLAVNWQEATGLDSLPKVFRLFDQRKEGALKLADLFPNALRQTEADSYRLNTPEFLEHWCVASPGKEEKRLPKWQLEKDEQLQSLVVGAESRQQVAYHKRWMSSSIRRMKKLGKSDAYCREKCALHLPKGSGPVDRERMHSFGDNDARRCRLEYTEKVIGTVRNVQKTFFELREQRMKLQESRRTMLRLTRYQGQGGVQRDTSQIDLSNLGGRRLSLSLEDDEEA